MTGSGVQFRAVRCDGADFFERRFGAVVLRCDVLLANIELFDAETGQPLAFFTGTDEVEAAAEFHAIHPDWSAALSDAVEALRDLGSGEAGA